MLIRVFVFLLKAVGTKDVVLSEQLCKEFEQEKHVEFIRKYSEDRSSYVSHSIMLSFTSVSYP